MDTCWSCGLSEYHNYKDAHGIRCPRCGQKQSDDPNRVTKVVKIEEPKKAPVKRTVRGK